MFLLLSNEGSVFFVFINTVFGSLVDPLGVVGPRVKNRFLLLKGNMVSLEIASGDLEDRIITPHSRQLIESL